MSDDLDLTEFMKEGSVSDLGWLDVNEEQYRQMDRLPKQNLDIAPDLQALWSHTDPSSIKYVPNTGGPRTMADLSQVHGPISKASEDLIRTARFAIMQSTDVNKISTTLKSRFDGNILRGAKTALASVLAERGLLGRVYIAAEDFPDCNRGGSKSSDFVRKYASDAKYLLAKTACGDCAHRQAGSGHCGVFHKQIVMEVPYTNELAREVEGLQAARGKAVLASEASPKERIRNAFLAQSVNQTPAFTGHAQAPARPIVAGNVDEKLISVANLTQKRDEAARAKVAAEKARPIIATLRREMLKGHSPDSLVRALRLAHDQRDLQETRAHWEPLFREAGLYGVVYTTQDSFSDCREGADFLARHASSVRAVVAGSKCSSCIFSKAGRCMMYGKKLVANASEVITPETVSAVLDDHRIAGRIASHSKKMSWGNTPAEALKALHRAASSPLPATTNLRSNIEQAFYGNGPRTMQSSDLTKREVVKAAKQYLNEGLYGNDLGMVLKGRFEVRDIVAAQSELRPVLAEQGLQGIKYIDPTAYDDYGAGCKTAASKHRSRTAVQYAKVGDKCASCVHQTRPGSCSVLNKQLVVEPPYVDKLAEQRAILASGRSTEVSYESLMNNGLTMMQEYQLQHTASTIDLNPEAVSIGSEIEFGPHQVKL